jgi:hypothetical protein
VKFSQLIFLASIGMCSAVYMRSFLAQRSIPFNEVVINQKMEYDQSAGMVKSIEIALDLPSQFPEKYKGAIKKVVDFYWKNEVKHYEETYLEEDFDEHIKVRKGHILYSLKILKELSK